MMPDLSTDLPLRLQDLGPNERPREKMGRYGPRSLSDAELVAVLIGSGTPGLSALRLSRRLLQAAGNNLHALARWEAADFRRHPGMGPVKALRLIAALELGRRREHALTGKPPVLGNSQLCFRYLWPLLGDLNHEEFHVLCLNRANNLLGGHRISTGGVSATVVDAKLVLRAALSSPGTTSIVLAHNHPSGQSFPSAADRQLTHKLVRAAGYLDLAVLDHVIIAGRSYYSFADDGLLHPPKGKICEAVN